MSLNACPCTSIYPRTPPKAHLKYNSTRNPIYRPIPPRRIQHITQRVPLYVGLSTRPSQASSKLSPSACLYISIYSRAPPTTPLRYRSTDLSTHRPPTIPPPRRRAQDFTQRVLVYIDLSERSSQGASKLSLNACPYMSFHPRAAPKTHTRPPWALVGAGSVAVRAFEGIQTSSNVRLVRS